MIRSDRIYTPEWLAMEMIASIRKRNPLLIADFSVGEGSLLDAALRRWPKIQIVANDRNSSLIADLARKRPRWHSYVSNFLGRHHPGLEKYRGKIDVILLNPPFSCRGGLKLKSNVVGNSASVALAFIVRALPFLRESGQLAAIVPVGTLTSQKDLATWNWIKQRYHVDIVRRYPYTVFPGYRVRCALIRLSKRTTIQKDRSKLPPATKATEPSLVRGTIQMHLARRSNSQLRLPLVHTTNLKEGRILLSKFFVKRPRTYISGPAILMPRVGKPDAGKFALLCKNSTIAISDCVIAIKPKRNSVRPLYQTLRANWEKVRKSYVGSCAPYITLARLKSVLSDLQVY